MISSAHQHRQPLPNPSSSSSSPSSTPPPLLKSLGTQLAQTITSTRSPQPQLQQRPRHPSLSQLHQPSTNQGPTNDNPPSVCTSLVEEGLEPAQGEPQTRALSSKSVDPSNSVKPSDHQHQPFFDHHRTNHHPNYYSKNILTSVPQFNQTLTRDQSSVVEEEAEEGEGEEEEIIIFDSSSNSTRVTEEERQREPRSGISLDRPSPQNVSSQVTHSHLTHPTHQPHLENHHHHHQRAKNLPTNDNRDQLSIDPTRAANPDRTLLHQPADLPHSQQSHSTLWTHNTPPPPPPPPHHHHHHPHHHHNPSLRSIPGCQVSSSAKPHQQALRSSRFSDTSAPSPVSSIFSSQTGMSNRSTAPSSSPLLLQSPTTPLPNIGTRNYTFLKDVGDGSFGNVFLADWHSPLTLPPGTTPPGPSSRPEYRGKKLVAVKRMKKPFEGGWDECMKLKELKSLRTIPMYPFIIPLYDAFLHPTTRELHFVFECMEGNLYQLTKSRKGRPLAGGLIACIFEQILLGLNHIHICGYFHRDMKPENLLITTTGLTDYPHGSPFALPTAPPERDVAVIVKIADFGLARETNSRPPYTEYVSTRWYRAPEVLLRARDYSNPVDLWALGAIMVETVTLKPLFPGNSEMDQVEKIMTILGDPKHNYGYDDKGRLRGGGQWLNGVALAEAVGFKFPDKSPMDFVQLFDVSNVPIQLVDCLHELLRYEPSARLTSSQCLAHPYFSEVACRLIPPSLSGAALIHHAAALANGISSPRSNGTGPPSSQNQNSSSNSMAVDLPSISPQIVPSSHSQFPNARPTHVLTPSNSTAADSQLPDPEHGRHLSPHHYSNHSHHTQIPSPSIPYNANPESQRRGSHTHEAVHQPGYDYPAPMVSREPSFLSLVPPSVPDNSRNTGATSKSRGRTLASVFSGSQSLKRTPSDRAPTDGASANVSTTALIDPKKAKKEAERAAKEEAKLESQAKREAARRSAQERSRAVLQKQRLAQGHDILIHVNPEFAAPGAPRKTTDKGKARAALHPPLPQIVEDVTRTRQSQGGGGGAGAGAGAGPAGGGESEADGARRMMGKPASQDRPVYDQSGAMGRSYRDEGRRFSFNSSNTMDSDPGPGNHTQAKPPERSPSLGSGYSRLSVASSPNLTSLYRASTPASTASSLEHQLVANMAGLSANERDSTYHHHHHTHHTHHHHHRHRQAPSNGSSRVASEEPGLRRSRSPSDPRFSPYAVPGPRPSLPSISNFDFSQHGPPPQPALRSPNLNQGSKSPNTPLITAQLQPQHIDGFKVGWGESEYTNGMLKGWIDDSGVEDDVGKIPSARRLRHPDDLTPQHEIQRGA